MNVLQNNFFNLEIFYKKSKIPRLSVGDKIKVLIYLELPKENADGKKKEKERVQAFEGVVISKHLENTNINSTFTIRKMFQGGGTEKMFFIHSPWTKTIEVLGRSVVRRSKLYYLRERTGKAARLKRRL